MSPPGLGHRDRRGTEVLFKQSPQVTFAHAEPLSKLFNADIVERAFRDKPEGARDGS